MGYLTESVLVSGKSDYCPCIEGSEGELGGLNEATLKAEGGEGDEEEPV